MPRGSSGSSTFYWPDHRLIGEFDGETKYRKPEMLRGRAPHEALMAEKYREDRLRAVGEGVTRWVTGDLRVSGRLALQLRRAGLTLGSAGPDAAPRYQPTGSGRPSS
jgi:hypothetical protein